MKNMRKGLVAAATALTVSLAGVSVATAQENESSVSELSSIVGSSQSTTPTVTPDGDDATDTTVQTSGSSDMEAKEIREWVGVFTAVIGALSTLFAFVNKL